MHCYFKCINFPPFSSLFRSHLQPCSTLLPARSSPIYRDFGRTIYWSCISGCQVWSKSTGVMIRLHVSLISILQHLSEIIASHGTDTIQSSAPRLVRGPQGWEYGCHYAGACQLGTSPTPGCRMMESGPVIGSPLSWSQGVVLSAGWAMKRTAYCDLCKFYFIFLSLNCILALQCVHGFSNPTAVLLKSEPHVNYSISFHFLAPHWVQDRQICYNNNNRCLIPI